MNFKATEILKRAAGFQLSGVSREAAHATLVAQHSYDGLRAAAESVAGIPLAGATTTVLAGIIIDNAYPRLIFVKAKRQEIL